MLLQQITIITIHTSSSIVEWILLERPWPHESMTSNNSQRSTPISPESLTLLESLDDTAVLQDGSNLQDISRPDRGLRSTPQPPEPPKTKVSVAELIH
jgi:hypothetical protein